MCYSLWRSYDRSTDFGVGLPAWKSNVREQLSVVGEMQRAAASGNKEAEKKAAEELAELDWEEMELSAKKTALQEARKSASEEGSGKG